MIRRINDITKKGKELAKRIIGPYLIIKMEGAVVTLIDSKSHKEFRVNIDRLIKYSRRLDAKLKILYNIYFADEDTHKEQMINEKTREENDDILNKTNHKENNTNENRKREKSKEDFK